MHCDSASKLAERDGVKKIIRRGNTCILLVEQNAEWIAEVAIANKIIIGAKDLP